MRRVISQGILWTLHKNGKTAQAIVHEIQDVGSPTVLNHARYGIKSARAAHGTRLGVDWPHVCRMSDFSWRTP